MQEGGLLAQLVKHGANNANAMGSVPVQVT